MFPQRIDITTYVVKSGLAVNETESSITKATPLPHRFLSACNKEKTDPCERISENP